jgi:hypothetical protein
MEVTAREPVLVDLALQGGGSYGAFTRGVLDRLIEEPWLRIDAISGKSAGAMNAAGGGRLDAEANSLASPAVTFCRTRIGVAVRKGERRKVCVISRHARASTHTEVDAAFAMITQQGTSALLIAQDPFFHFRYRALCGSIARASRCP